MQYYGGLEMKHIILKCQVCDESVAPLDKEEHWCPEEHVAFSLQCGESLAVALNRIMEENFGVKQRLRALIHSVEIALSRPCEPPSLGQPSRDS